MSAATRAIDASKFRRLGCFCPRDCARWPGKKKLLGPSSRNAFELESRASSGRVAVRVVYAGWVVFQWIHCALLNSATSTFPTL